MSLQRQTIRERVPEGVELREVRADVTLPAGLVISSTRERELRTRSRTTIQVRANPTGIFVRFAPALVIDAQWPWQNMRLRGVTHYFASAETGVDVQLIEGMAEGFVDARGTARENVRAVVAGAVQGTPIARRGYNPFEDPELLQRTVHRVAANFRSLPTQGASQASAGSVGNVSVGAQIAVPEGLLETPTPEVSIYDRGRY